MVAATTDRSLAGRVGVVTGASRGIGLAIATELVRRGAKVCITGRKPDALDAAVGELGGPAHALGVAGNAADEGHQAETLERAVETFGKVDMLVNNAAINPVYGPTVDIVPDVAAKILHTNVLAPLAWTRRARELSLAEHSGSVVNVASIGGLRASPGIGLYGVSKAALIRLTMELAHELGPDIRVNAVAPGIVKTDFSTALYDGRENEVAAEYPLRRLGVPNDIAGAVAFLLSREAAWITGQTLTIDGGVTLGGGL